MKFSELSSHHAILITHPDRPLCADALWLELQAISPAHRFFNQTVLDIETARDIISWAKTPYNEERIALVSFHTAGIPAQNALLKILEEPPEKTRFILLTSNKENLIATVVSRLQHYEDRGPITISDNTTAANIFLRTKPTERMKLPFIVELLEKKDEEDRKDREAVREFILSVVRELSSSKEDPHYITETLEFASYASDPSASGKALIEYLSLLLPQTS